MPRQGDVLEIIGGIYDCAIEPQYWPDTLKQIAAHINADCGAISIQDPVARSVRLAHAWNASPEFETAMLQSSPFNPMMSAGWFVDVDDPFTSLSYLGQEYYATRFYTEIVQPHGYIDAALMVIAKDLRRSGAISMPRLESRGQFTADDIRQFRVLGPHIRRSVMIGDLLDARALKDDLLSATLDLLTVGVVLVDVQSRIVHANRAGLVMLDERAAVRRDGDRIGACDPKALADLRDAIAKASGGSALAFPTSGIALPLIGSNGRDLAAWVLPLDSGLRTELAAPFAASAAIFLQPLGGGTAPFPGELFVKRYGITPAECRVLMLLTQGMSLREAADTLGISEPTVKTHLARLFHKTGTARQADLMRLAMSALAPAARTS